MDGTGTGTGTGDPDAVRMASPDLAAPVTVCPDCGGIVADDGYCEQCGSPAPKPRDHWVEQPAAWVAGVCDRGVRHARNEDAMALAATGRGGGFAALVVCDGVSSSTGSDVASLAAARAARDMLAAVGPAPVTGNLPGEEGHGWAEAVDRVLAERVTEAGLTAHAQVVAAAGDPPRLNPPSCTFVAAAVQPAALVVGWVGDSRGYWLPDGGGTVQLSVDDSWAAEQMALGATREEAESSPRAHAITRWLGVDAPQPVPRIAALTLESPGWVLLCSDGLWNYCSAPDQLGVVLDTAIAQVGDRPEAVAAALVAWATEQGGRDNITVALARVDGQGWRAGVDGQG